MNNEQETELIQTEKQKEDKINIMEERFKAIQSQMQLLITMGNMDEASKNTFAKHLFNSGIYKQLKTEEYPPRLKHFPENCLIRYFES
jgi:hypothetical protein